MTPLDTGKVSGDIVVGCLEPIVAVAVPPRGDATPTDDTWVQVALVEEKSTGFRNQEWTVEILLIAKRVETVGLLLDGLRVGIFGEDDVAIIGEPLAGINEA